MTNKKEARWFSDKSTLENGLFKFNRNEDGFYLKMTPEDCRIGNILLENADRWIDEKNKELREKEIPKECLDILKNPDLFNEITEKEFDKKIVGEVESRKTIFLCANGRLVENCNIASYNLLVNDDAGAGKDYVVSKVLEILPKEVYIHKTRISATVFTYWHNELEWTWDGIVFYPEDISEVVLNSDVFKVMCSGGSSATITQKVLGKIQAIEIEIKGKPVMITTTASAVPNPELTRRFAILNLDSSENQTKAIMKRHSEFKKKGIVPCYNPIYTEALRHLKRVKIKIPFADLIDQHFPTNNIMMRTNYPRFLDYISASAGFHQYQRKQDDEDFILTEGQDYNIARECFLKLCSNKYMINLTINQKKILKVFEDNPLLRDSVTHLHSGKMNFISDRALATNLGLLVRYGILETDIEKDICNRDIEVFSLSKNYNPNEKIYIPTFEELCILTSIPSIHPIPPIPSIASVPKTFKRGSEGSEGSEPIKVIEEAPKSIKVTEFEENDIPRLFNSKLKEKLMEVL